MTKTQIDMNGSKVTKRGETYFVALPADAQRQIAGGCQCAWCLTHPDRTPMWDTLAIGEASHAWTVHYPELPRFAE